MESQGVVLVLGCGLMGSAMARRLFDVGYSVHVWNRSYQKALDLSSSSRLEDRCIVAFSDLHDAFKSLDDSGLVVLFLHDMDSVKKVLSSVPASCLAGKRLLNLVSGNSDQGREMQDMALQLGVSLFIDACYLGPPHRLQQGQGILMVSTKSGLSDDVTPLFAPMFEKLSSLWKYAGPTGASRALDYALVDIFLANFVSFASGLSLMDAENVEMDHFFELLGHRLSSVADQLKWLMSGPMKERHESGDYITNPMAKLETYGAFLKGRIPYMQSRGLDTTVPQFYASLVDATSQTGQEDFTLLQEKIRYPKEKQ